MQDRVPVNPGRVLVTPENGGAAYYATLTRADNPTQEGTPLNKDSLLKDATAALFGLGANAVPDDALSAIKTLIDGANANANAKAKIATGSYTGTGTYGKSNPNSLTFDFVPKFVAFSSTRYTAFGYLLNPGTRARLCGNATESDQTVTWNNKTVSWYSDDAHGQLNFTNTEYYYIAIG